MRTTPTTITTASPQTVTVYDVYECLRNQLNTRHDSTIIYKNEIVQVTALVMMLEDHDATLAARFEAERSPKPVAPAITKAVTKYDRKEIAKNAHYYAKVATGAYGGKYHKHFGKGMKDAWSAAKAAGIVVPTKSIHIIEDIKPVRIPAISTYGTGLFDHDTLYYHVAQYSPFTVAKPFNSSQNHALRY